jgi:hypothetical protein
LGEWEISDNKLYLTKIAGSGQIKNQEKFRLGRLELREKLKSGIITPQENGKLLKKLEENCFEDIELSLLTLFNSKNKVFADWFSGILKCPYGKMTKYIHMGYDSKYSNVLEIHVKEGEVIELKRIKN